MCLIALSGLLVFGQPAFAASLEPAPRKVLTPKLPWVSKDTAVLSYDIPKELDVYPSVIEDPDWYFPRPGSNESKPEYKGRSGLGSGYLAVLDEALKGNPVAMADLVMMTQYAPERLAAAYPQFPKEMHSKEFWMGWIAKYTSPGWAYAAVSKYDEGIGSASTALNKGALLGDPKSMYLLTQESGGELESRQWTMIAADAGFRPAAYRLSRFYRYGDAETGYQVLQDTQKMNRYLELAKERGNAWAFADAAHDAYRGLNGKKADAEEMYFNCTIFFALLDREDGLPLIDRAIPSLRQLDEFELQTCISKVSQPTKPLTAEEEAQQTVTDQERASLLPSQEIIQAATKRAYAWLSQHKAMREAELAPERVRRAELTKQLRETCAPAVTYMENQKKGQ